MTQAQNYRMLGWIFTISGLIKLSPLVLFGDFTKLPSLAELHQTTIVIVAYIVTNYLLWIGLFFHWRADKNISKTQRSKWGISLIIFLIITVLFLIGIRFNFTFK